MPPEKPPILCVSPLAVLVPLKLNTGVETVVPNLSGNSSDWLVEAGVEMVKDVVVVEDVEVMAEAVVLGAVLDVTGLTVGWKPVVDVISFSFIPFVKSNLKPPTELVAVLLVVAFNRNRLLLDVTGFIPKYGVPLGSAVDGMLPLLAELKTVTSVGLEPLVAADVTEEPCISTFASVQFTVNADFNNEFEGVVADVQTVVFTEGDAAVLPKLKKLLVVSATGGFAT